MEVVELQNSLLRCVIAPQLGASVVRLDVQHKKMTVPVLVPTPEENLTETCDPRLLSLAPIAPIGGLVRHNHFKWEGKVYDITPNFSDLPLFYNGIAWQQPWTGKKDGKNAASFRFFHKKDSFWPFDFSLTTIYDLETDHLKVTHELSYEGNTGTMPWGLGATMRLPGNASTHLCANVGGIWNNDPQGVPLKPAEIPFNLDLKEGLTLAEINCEERWFNDWVGTLSAEYVEKKISLMIKAHKLLSHLGFTHNKSEPEFRVTALSHVPGMMDLVGYDEDETGLKNLGPGESVVTSFKIDVDVNLY